MSPIDGDGLPDYATLDRYFAGESSAAEISLVRAWIAAEPARPLEVERLRAIWRAGGSTPPDVEAALRRITERERVAVSARALSRAPSGRIRPRVPLSPTWRRTAIPVAIAASVLVAVTTGIVATSGRNSWRSRTSAHEYVTAPGFRTTVTLTDGTQFVLAPASRLRVAVDYGRRRGVFLEGEAYFTVTHDAARPFTVHAGSAIARDIGTQFDVRAYAGDAAVRVAVAAGRVGVEAGWSRRGAIVSGALRGAVIGSAPSRASADRPPPATDRPLSATLAAGDLAVIDTAVAIAHGADVAGLTGWTRGRLIFDATPLGEVARTLSRWYAVPFVVADSTLATVPLTATYTTESPDQVAALLATATGARYERRGPTFVFTPR